MKNYMPQVESINYKDGLFHVPVNTARDIIVKAVREGYVYEQYIVNKIEKNYIPGTCIIDLGANYGQMTLEYSKIATAGYGHVYAFEANPVVFDCLVRNIDSYKLDNVTPIFGSVSNRVGDRVHFPTFDENNNQTYGSLSITDYSKFYLPISTITVDSIDYKLPVSCIKMDLQGYELFALIGAKKLLTANKPFIVFEYEDVFSSRLGINFSDYLKFFQEVSYEIVEGPLDESQIVPNATNVCVAKPKF